ncbi:MULTISPECIES: RDD family protein [unclassified Spirillospora]|uniref:RDD family protein n=1 Tax=unclassified Spirillospora TaxID=2642701 RepID=UPI00371EA4B9
MSEPPQNPQPAGGDWQAPDPQAADTPAPDAPDAPAVSNAEDVSDASPERPPPYQGTYGAQPGQAPPAPAPGAGYAPPGQPQPGYGPPAQPGYGPPGLPYPGYTHPGAGGPQDMLAGRWARLGAGVLDSLILSFVATPAVLLSIRWDKMQESMTSGEPIINPMDLYNIPRLLAGYAVVFLLGFVYFTVMHAKWGQTLGKKALGIRVVSAADQSAVSWGQAIGRQAFVYAITISTALVNFLVPAGALLGMVGMLDNAWILWDDRRQALHDKVAGTLVVKAQPWMPNPYARPEAPADPGKL